jgi:hypothetical protein
MERVHPWKHIAKKSSALQGKEREGMAEVIA